MEWELFQGEGTSVNLFAVAVSKAHMQSHRGWVSEGEEQRAREGRTTVEACSWNLKRNSGNWWSPPMAPTLFEGGRTGCHSYLSGL